MALDAAKYAAAGAGVGAATAGAASLGLSAVGFTSAGVAAGSFAAGMQTATVAAGSAFAVAQSVGATGVLLTVGLPVAIAVGAIGGISYFAYNYLSE